LSNPEDPIPTPSPGGEGRPAAQATAVAGGVASSPPAGGGVRGGLW